MGYWGMDKEKEREGRGHLQGLSERFAYIDGWRFKMGIVPVVMGHLKLVLHIRS